MNHKIPRDCVVSIDGVAHTQVGYVAGRRHIMNSVTGQPFVAAGPDGVVGLITDDQFDDLLESGRLVLEHANPLNRTRLINSTAQWTVEQALAIDPAAEKKHKQVEMCDAAGVANGDKAIEIFMAKHWTAALIKKYGPADKPRTIRKWRATRGRAGRRHVREMVSLTGRVPRGPYCADVPSEIIGKHVLDYWTTFANFKDAFAGVVTEITQVNEGRHPDYPAPDSPYDIPSESTVRRRCHRIDTSDAAAAKHGDAKLQQDWLGAGRPLTSDFPFQRIIIDHTKLDVHVVDLEREMVLGRAWISFAVDVNTRIITAHVITFLSPSVWTAGEVLRRAALPKRPPSKLAKQHPILRKVRGKPSEVITDNAAEFRSESFRSGCQAAGISLRWCPLKKPRYRAIIERAISTLNREICHNLPGRTLSVGEARRVDDAPAGKAFLKLDALEAIANQVVAEYNTDPHDGINNRQPALLFERGLSKYGVNEFLDLESFRRDTMAVQTGAQLSPGGIRAFGNLRYHDFRAVRELLDDLVPLECRRKRRDDATATVDFRYDPLDISKIYVWNRKTLQYVTLRCSDETYGEGMPLAFHEQIRKQGLAEGREYNTEADRLAARTRRIQAIRNIDRKATEDARKRVADLYEIPRIRQIVGNIVNLTYKDPNASLSEFISNDRAATTALDREIMGPQPPRRRREPDDGGWRDPRGTTSASADQAQPKKRRRPSPKIAGDKQ